MSLLSWYNVARWASWVTLAIFALVALWYCIDMARKNLDNTKSTPALIITGLLLIATVTSQLILESKVYPAGQCPNCEQSVTSRYCEDCGWQNDSYFEQTDRED